MNEDKGNSKNTKETDKARVGRIGEDIAEIFLVKKGYTLDDRNFRKKWGEIDLVTHENKILVFVEVKTEKVSVTHENKGYRIEENIHKDKLKRLTRAIYSYLKEKNVSDETEWRLDAVIVRLDTESKKARVSHIKNILAE
ncbi:MAG: YraN family protein [Candidatus Paceibacterota bacterium]